MYQPRLLSAYTRRLVDNFGQDFTLLMVSVYFLVKGVFFSFLMGSSLPFFKNYLGMGGDKYQSYNIVAGVWCGVG